MSLRRKEPAEPAVTEKCGQRADNVRAECSLPKGHVKGPDDWHETTADATDHAITNIFETTIIRHEHIRWAPHMFELPKEHVVKALGPSATTRRTPHPTDAG